MLGDALYYPYIDIHDTHWLRSAVLFWDRIQTIVPSSISDPYQEEDARVCAQEGYLQPLHCDLHPDILDNLGKRVLKLIQDPKWVSDLTRSASNPARDALIHADKIGHEIRWQIEGAVGIHPDKMPRELRSILPMLFGGIGPAIIEERKLSPHLRHLLHNFGHYGELFHNIPQRYHDGNWILVDSQFAAVYMSALAALLAREVQVSPLTHDEPASGVNLRCLVDDVAETGPAAAKGALVSVVMEGLKIDPETPMWRLLEFRRQRTSQLAELSGHFDELRGKIEKSASAQELETSAKSMYENKIRPGLDKLKSELRQQTIQSAWEGVQRAITVSAPAGGMLATVSGLSGAMLLGAGAFITLADVGIKSYLARNKARASSPYTYLFDMQRQFSLPR